MASAKPASKTPISRLPLARKTLQGALARLPLGEEPSAQRISTTFSPKTRGVWARTLPLWGDWPIRITKEEALALGCDVDKGEKISVEAILGRWDLKDAPKGDNGLALKTSDHRLKMAPVLLGFSEKTVHDCLPQLDIGDAADLNASVANEGGNETRELLVDVLSGRKVLEGEEYMSWSTRYCGHQFGVWAGQLGDGRAISLLEVEDPNVPGGRTEIQVKGAGRTPFARSADGLAVLRSSVREYLGCEAISALGIPTTRALAILTSPVRVMREQGPEPSSLVARVAPSFIRIGHFEAMNPGDAAKNTHQLFLGGGWRSSVEDEEDKNDPLGGQGNLEGLRDLTAWMKDVMGMENATANEWFIDVVRRNAETVAQWQVYGFMHGVLNTDNISVLGLTIDYGPYAFMDVFDQNHICNHSDPSGLYNYKGQPGRVLFALDSLASSLLPILGYETQNGKLPPAGWSEGATPDDVRGWEAAGLESIESWSDLYNQIEQAAERKGWQKRFGLTTYRDGDDRDVVKDFQYLLHGYDIDFGAAFRLLSYFRTSRVDDAEYLKQQAKLWIAQATNDLLPDIVSRTEEGIVAWLRTYAKRVNEEKFDEDARLKQMQEVNPRFVLRQWVLEDTISKMEEALKEDNVPEARKVLARVLDLSTNPFKAYGEDSEGKLRDDLSGEAQEQARLCSLGPKSMLGYQCSCSS